VGRSAQRSEGQRGQKKGELDGCFPTHTRNSKCRVTPLKTATKSAEHMDIQKHA
jgi:hypothetical protein